MFIQSANIKNFSYFCSPPEKSESYMNVSKTIISAYLLVAVALTSCEKREAWVSSTGAKVDLTLSLVTHSPSTKTTFEVEGSDTYVRWTASDKLNVLFDSWKDGAAPILSMPNSSSSTGTGKFEGMALGIPDGSHMVYAFASDSGYELKADTKIQFNILDTQAPGRNTFDPAADIVVNRRYHLVVKADEDHAIIDDMSFNRIPSTVMVSVYNKTDKDLSGERISKITLESNAQGLALTGAFIYDFEKGNLKIVSAIPKVTATLSTPLEIGSGDKAYILIAPVTLPEGSTFKVVMETEHYRISKTVSLPEDMPFSADKVSSLTLNLQDSDTVIVKL